jgi:copper transport protein
MDSRRAKSSRRHSAATATLALALFLLLFPSIAAAHAKLVRSEPQANATLKQAPKAVELWFSEALEHNFCAVVVTDQNRNRVDKNNLNFPEGDKQLRIDLGELVAGTYTVEWKILSADQHSMKGSFTFTVATAGTSAAPVSPAQHTNGSGHPESQQQSAPSSEPMQQSGSSWTESIARWLHHLAMMMLFGGFAFQLLVMGPALQRSRGMTDVGRAVVRGASARRVVLFSWLSLALLVIVSLVELVIQSSTVFDKSLREALSSELLNQVITQTGFGASWRLQVWAAAALLIIVFYLSRGVKREPAGDHKLLWLGGLVASAVLFLAPAWTGHAAAAAKEYPFATARRLLESRRARPPAHLTPRHPAFFAPRHCEHNPHLSHGPLQLVDAR